MPFTPDAYGRINWYSGDLLTGLIFGRLPLKSTSWSNVMDDSGALQGTANLNSPDVLALNVPSVAAEAKCFLACAYEDPSGVETFLQGGPIWNHAYDDVTGKLTITAAGLWSYYDKRKFLAAAIANGATDIAKNGGLSFTGWALGTIAKKALQAIGARTNGLPPVIFQADEAMPADDAHTRTWNGWDMANAGTELRNLTNVINGPEIRFRPRRKTADPRYLEWVMDAGTEAQPLLSNPGGDWVFDAAAPISPVAGVNVATDATGMADIAWAKGLGSEADSLTSVSIGSTLTALGYPLLETEVTGHDSVEVQATLDSYTQAARLAGAKRIITPTARVHRDANPSLARYQVGDYVTLINRDNHPYLAGQTLRSRIVQRSGDDTAYVSLQLQPVLV